MNRYWLGIAAGAVAVFGVGMAGMAVGKKGLAELKTVAAGPVRALQGPIGALRFRLDGERIGRLRSLEVQSHGDWTEDAVRLIVALDDPDLTDRVSECAIAGDRFGGPKDDASFRCVSAADIADDNLVPIGVVRFEPGAVDRPLYVAERDRRQLERSEIRGLKANLTSEDGETVTGRAAFDIQNSRGEREKGVVNIQAGDGRAIIDIRDESGRQVFRLNADDHGLSLNASDKRGRELVRLLAGSAGLSLKVDKGDGKI